MSLAFSPSPEFPLTLVLGSVETFANVRLEREKGSKRVTLYRRKERGRRGYGGREIDLSLSLFFFFSPSLLLLLLLLSTLSMIMVIFQTPCKGCGNDCCYLPCFAFPCYWKKIGNEPGCYVTDLATTVPLFVKGSVAFSCIFGLEVPLSKTLSSPHIYCHSPQ
ncbi:hypothetical protein I7I53_03546 [Histoplasma capsulatum var. duboisii H88]|uniref:Uncharacterized protein n=1 Tax=Ajellomyces capsulatus (strain H88) TaxID=544711 RepID=A0A8A1LNU3_AJEC8|nr:hypothetical protein I7I53_03546 [Histoplasma capsulatum var. duboisii H88]